MINDTSLHTSYHYEVLVYPYTAHADSPQIWLTQLEQGIPTIKSDAAAHARWWHDFWQRSWIFVDGDEEARKVTQGYVLQRFVSACAGRGAYPIKFNGSIFTADITGPKGEKWGADYRTWGGCYWFQNTRC